MMRIVSAKQFKKDLATFMNRGKADLSSIVSTVVPIIEDVKKDGDKALLKYTEKFDKVSLEPSKLKVSQEEIKQAYKKLDKKDKED